jgi:multidrug efflux pump subunit AcrA (membrane-fusion protein)
MTPLIHSQTPRGADRRAGGTTLWQRLTGTRRAKIATALVALLLVLGVGALATKSTGDDDQATGTTAAGEHAGEAGEHADGDHDEGEANRVVLTEASFAAAQIQVAAVTVGSAALASPGLDAPGQVEYDPSRVALASPRTDGRIERLVVVEGDRVRAGQPVAYLQSKEFLIAQSDLQQAARRAGVLADGPDAAGAAALLRAARQRMTLLGVPAAQIARTELGGDLQLFLPLVAPIGGVVLKAHVLAGQVVTAGEPVFTMADLSVVDVVASIQERSVPMVSVGQAATVTLTALPSLPLKGRVERLRGELNQETRTVQAVIHVANSNGTLRPGMFASVRIAVPATAYPELRAMGDSAREVVVTIPESAVVTDGERRYVFVQTAPFTFERREVQVAPLAPAGSSVASSAFVLVRGGLKPGERVVSRGAFTLKSELAKAGLGEHAH